MRTRLRKLDDEAFEALRSCLVAKSRAIRLRAYEVWSDLRMRTAPPKELRAGRQMLEGEFTEAQYLAMEEHAKLMAKNEAGE